MSLLSADTPNHMKDRRVLGADKLNFCDVTGLPIWMCWYKIEGSVRIYSQTRLKDSKMGTSESSIRYQVLKFFESRIGIPEVFPTVTKGTCFWSHTTTYGAWGSAPQRSHIRSPEIPRYEQNVSGVELRLLLTIWCKSYCMNLLEIDLPGNCDRTRVVLWRNWSIECHAIFKNRFENGEQTQIISTNHSIDWILPSIGM